MNFDKVIQSVTPEIYNNMQNAVATGKWPNGVALTEEQKTDCLQIIIAYDEKYKSEEDRTGYLPEKPKGSPKRSAREANKSQADDSVPLKILDQ